MELASICRRAHTELEGTAILSRSRGRDRWFESTFLQRRVACEPEDDVGIPVPRGNCPKPRDGFSGPPIDLATRLPPRVPRKRGQSLRFIT
jgi:hypothetical protein